MAFKRIQLMEIWEILRRWHDSQPIRTISSAVGCDRKTVRSYIALAKAEGLTRETVLERKEEILPRLQRAVERLHSKATKQDLLRAHIPEILDLVNSPENPLKPKTAFEVVCSRHDLTGEVSYSSFKRLAKREQISRDRDRTTCRIELPPAQQLQIDYGRVGLLTEPGSGRRRVVYAFIGTLSFSRHKYVEFVHRQDQQSFVQSHVNMFTFFSGVPKTLSIDNLKSGVIRSDLYYPVLNKAYAEMAEHYSTFIDPCRVVSPRDKGKVERDVQTIREFFRKEIALYPRITISELNRAVLLYLRDGYGAKKHGTTGQKPYTLFTDYEKAALIPLPPDPYTVAAWKQATVHPDHYIQVKGKYYSIPHPFVGRTVQVKLTPKLLQVYYQERLIKTHPLARTLRQTDWNDFPSNVQHALDEGLPRLLCLKARHIGVHFEELITEILSVHAFLNLRRAQGLLSLARRYAPEIIDRAAERALSLRSRVGTSVFKHILDALDNERPLAEEELPLSGETQSYVRPAEYFTHNTGDHDNAEPR